LAVSSSFFAGDYERRYLADKDTFWLYQSCNRRNSFSLPAEKRPKRAEKDEKASEILSDTIPCQGVSFRTTDALNILIGKGVWSFPIFELLICLLRASWQAGFCQ
jgi:hypothetical protein